MYTNVRKMTTLQSQIVTCPKCHQEFTAVYYPSICTWLNPELIQEIYDAGYNAECLHCGKKLPIIGNILINAPGGMFFLNTGMELKDVREILRQSGLIDDEGQVLNMMLQVKKLKEKREVASKRDDQKPGYFV